MDYRTTGSTGRLMMKRASLWMQRARGLSLVDKGLACCALGGALSAALAAALAGSGQLADYRPGDGFATVAGLDPSQSGATVVIFLNTNCGASQRSSEIFREVAARPRPYRVAVVGYESEALLKPFVHDSASEPDVVVSAPVGTIRFARVPQVALLDQRGVVRSVWSGSQEIATSKEQIVSAARTLAARQSP